MASTYDAQCLNHKGKFSGCRVNIENSRLQIEYEPKKEQDLNIDIPCENIKSLSAGEYARRRVAESIGGAVLFGPLALFMLFSKKKRDQVGIEYITENKETKATMVQVKKKYGLALKSELQALSGKEVREEEAKK